MKKSIYLFLLGLVLVFATSCSKNDKEPSANSSSQGDPKNPIEASVILATADITYVDDNGRKGEFKGSKASQFSNIKSEHTVADITEINDGFVMRILFYDEVRKTDLNVLIGRREGSTKEFSTGTYLGDDPDFFITFNFNADKSMYSLLPNMKHLKYKDQDIIHNGKLIIAEFSEHRIKGTFTFDAYTALERPLLKVEVRNGQFEGEIYRVK